MTNLKHEYSPISTEMKLKTFQKKESGKQLYTLCKIYSAGLSAILLTCSLWMLSRYVDFIPYKDDSKDWKEKQCIRDYKEGLMDVQMKNGDFREFVELMDMETTNVKWNSDDEMIFGIGPGTTATHALAETLYVFGLNTLHWVYGRMSLDSNIWFHDLYNRHQNIDKKKESFEKCQDYYNNYNFVFPETENKIHALIDTPISNYFLDLYRTYPNAKFILTTRDPDEWAVKRKTHGRDSALLHRPCGMKNIVDFDDENMAKLFRLHEKLVECVVPEERLLRICINCKNVTYGEVGSFLGRNPSDFGLDADLFLPKLNLDMSRLVHGAENKKRKQRKLRKHRNLRKIQTLAQVETPLSHEL